MSNLGEGIRDNVIVDVIMNMHKKIILWSRSQILWKRVLKK